MMSNDGLEELTASDIGMETAEKQRGPSGMNLSRKKRAAGSEARRKVWIDLENSPHVPFFWPIMRELEKLNYEGPAHVTVQARSLSLKRVFVNLVANAVNYGGSARVRLVTRDPRMVVVEVEDDGPGIPPSELDRVFEPFHRGEPSHLMSRRSACS